MTTAPPCTGWQHTYRVFAVPRGRVFRKGSLCLCGAAVLDRQVRTRHDEQWLVAGGWFALLNLQAHPPWGVEE